MLRIRWIAASMALLLVWGSGGAAAAAAEGPQRVSANLLMGRILKAGAKEAAGGATIRLYHLASGRQFSTVTAEATGTYILTELPDGTYEFSVETSDGRFFAAEVVTLAGGTRTRLSFTLSRELLPQPVRDRLARSSLGGLETDGLARAVREAAGPAAAGRAGRNTAIILASVASGYLLYEVLEDDEASPSAP